MSYDESIRFAEHIEKWFNRLSPEDYYNEIRWAIIEYSVMVANDILICAHGVKREKYHDKIAYFLGIPKSAISPFETMYFADIPTTKEIQQIMWDTIEGLRKDGFEFSERATKALDFANGKHRLIDGWGKR